MIEWLHRCIQPTAVLMLFIAAVCILGYGYPAWTAKTSWWLLWLFIGVLAAIAWTLLVFT